MSAIKYMSSEAESKKFFFVFVLSVLAFGLTLSTAKSDFVLLHLVALFCTCIFLILSWPFIVYLLTGWYPSGYAVPLEYVQKHFDVNLLLSNDLDKISKFANNNSVYMGGDLLLKRISEYAKCISALGDSKKFVTNNFILPDLVTYRNSIILLSIDLIPALCFFLNKKKEKQYEPEIRDVIKVLQFEVRKSLIEQAAKIKNEANKEYNISFE